MRKYIVSSLIILIMAFTFCIGYFSVPQNIYADSSTDQWTSVTTNQELADAFRYYCKSRNLAIEGSVFHALTSFTTNSFNTICDSLGIDVTALQAHLKRSTDSNGKVQFLFDQFGVTAYNRIFAEFLQNNDISVGDQVENKNLYDGKSIYGNTVFIGPRSGTATGNIIYSIYQVEGSPYLVNTSDIISLSDLHVKTDLAQSTWGEKLLKFSAEYTDSYYGNYKGYIEFNGVTSEAQIIYHAYKSGTIYGYFCLLYCTTDGNLYAGMKYGNRVNACNQPLITAEDSDYNNIVNTNIYITTNNQTINNNNYEDNSQTVINNEGDVYNYDYDDDDPPVNPPSGGGGDDPSGGGGDDDPIDWPNITFPNILPHLQIPNLKDKFPFSIPWDLIAFYAILNVDPVCPEIETDINLGIVQWHVDLSLEDFEPAAEICRDMYFIAFCVGLIIVTRDLIRG